MAARRNHKRKRARRPFGPLFKVLCAVAVAVALTMGATVFFQVEYILVDGNSRYTKEEIIAITGLQVGDNLFHMNKFDMIQLLEQQLPYIQTVTIRRSLPNTVVITVKELDAVAQIQSPEGSWLISANGKLLEQAPADNASMVISGLTPLTPQAGADLAVSQEEDTRLHALLALLNALAAQDMSAQISALDVTASRIVMRYLERFNVRLPLNGDFSYQLKVLRTAAEDLNQRVGEQTTGTLDLTQTGYSAVFLPE